LYYRFRDIHDSDQDLRAFIKRHRDDLPTTYPIEVAFNLRATRTGVLEVGKIGTLQPGMHVYPNHIALPQTPEAYRKVLRLLQRHFGVENGTPDQIERRAGAGVEIDADAAVALVAPIKTGSKNTWRDSTIADVIRKVAEKFDGRVTLRFRTAQRTVREEGFISTGTLSGDELRNARDAAVPTLWLMSAHTAAGSVIGGGIEFMYPTFVIPNDLDGLFIFNRGS
jgi:hypothetical protein